MVRHEEREALLRQELARCAENRRQLTNELVEMHLEATLAMARQFAPGDDGLREDLESDLLDALVHVAERYNPEKAAFWTYAHAHLRGRVRMFFRKRGRQDCADLASAENVANDDDVPALIMRRHSDKVTIEWARLMLAEVGLPTSAPAVQALLGVVKRRHAAQALGINYDVFLRKINAVPNTRAARAFRTRAN